MIETINQILDFLIANYALYMVVTMSVIISFTIVLLTFIKKPIKALTCKIPNEKIRKLANKIFILIAFGLSALAWITLHLVMPKYFSYQPIEILLTGAFSVVLYALGDGVITRSNAKQLIDEIVVDINEQKEAPIKEKKVGSHSAVSEFLKKVK